MDKKTQTWIGISTLVIGGVGCCVSGLNYLSMGIYSPWGDELNDIANECASQWSKTKTITCHASFMPNGVSEKVSLSSFDALYFDMHGELFFQDKKYFVDKFEYTYTESYYKKSACTDVWERVHSPSNASDYLFDPKTVPPEKKEIAQRFNAQFQKKVNALMYKNYNPSGQKIALYALFISCVFCLVGTAFLIKRCCFSKSQSSEAKNTLQVDAQHSNTA